MRRIVPGIHSVIEAFKVRPRRISELWIREGAVHGELEAIDQTARQAQVKVRRVSQKTLDGQVASHQGVIAFVEEGPPWPSTPELKNLEAGFILALDTLEDPHNVGSLARSCWNLGCIGILTTKERSAGASPAAQKVASGGFEHVPFLEVSNLAAELISLKELGFWVYGLDAQGSERLDSVDFSPKGILVIGAEESGLRKPVKSACDVLVSIPQVSNAESYNAAVAGALAGYEFLRQRNLSKNSKISRKKI